MIQIFGFIVEFKCGAVDVFAGISLLINIAYVSYSNWCYIMCLISLFGHRIVSNGHSQCCFGLVGAVCCNFYQVWWYRSSRPFWLFDFLDLWHSEMNSVSDW